MQLISLDIARQHCRVEQDETDELMTIYLGAAEQSAIDYLGRQVFATQQDLDTAKTAGTAGENPIVVNYAIRAAILLTLGHLYMNREDVVVGVSAAEMPRGARDLLRPHRIPPGV